jgi:hypothetical protein
MDKKCQNEDCSDDDCSGSNDEGHHCEFCIKLSWVGKGLECTKCGDYYCILHWQMTFVTLDCMANVIPDNDRGNLICWNCYEDEKAYHCQIPDCGCDQNFYENYQKHRSLMHKTTRIVPTKK